jgi:hypothetical protein
VAVRKAVVGCDLWKKLLWAVSCEKAESRLAGTTVICEKTAVSWEMFVMPLKCRRHVDIQIIVNHYLFTKLHANHQFRKEIFFYFFLHSPFTYGPHKFLTRRKKRK